MIKIQAAQQIIQNNHPRAAPEWSSCHFWAAVAAAAAE
jgi:hypothetical protein